MKIARGGPSHLAPCHGKEVPDTIALTTAFVTRSNSNLAYGLTTILGVYVRAKTRRRANGLYAVIGSRDEVTGGPYQIERAVDASGRSAWRILDSTGEPLWFLAKTLQEAAECVEQIAAGWDVHDEFYPTSRRNSPQLFAQDLRSSAPLPAVVDPMAGMPEGFYPDPFDPRLNRQWDGSAWTSSTSYRW